MSIEEIIRSVNKKYGSETLLKGSQIKDLSGQRASTGSLVFDLILGGGFPLNKWNEIIGQPSNGKTVMALKTIAAQQKDDPKHQTLWIAAEEFVPDWAQRLGVNLDQIYVADTNVMEDAFTILHEALSEKAVDAVVVDSLPALVPGKEYEKNFDEVTVGLAARLNGLAFRKTGKSMKRSLVEDDRDVLALIINQWRYKIGVLHGDPRTTPGGEAKNYAFFTRTEVSRDEWLTDSKKRKVGISIKARTMKNKTAPVGQVGVVDFYFDNTEGFSAGEYDSIKEIFTLGDAFGVIEQGGGYYSFNGERLNEDRGKEHAVARLRYDLDLQSQIRDEITRVVLHKNA